MDEPVDLYAVAKLAFGIITFGLLTLTLLRRSRASRKPTSPVQDFSGPRRVGSNLWLWILLIVVVAGFTYGVMPKNPRPVLPRRQTDWSKILLTFVPPVLLIAGIFTVVWLRNRDPAWVRARRMFQDGDLAGAIRTYRTATETRPSPIGLNNLGILYFEGEEYAEALRCFLDAEKLERTGPSGRIAAIKEGATFEINQAMTLRKLGRPREALPLIESVLTKHPDQGFFVLHHALILADLDRSSEAREEWRRFQGMPMHRTSNKTDPAEWEKLVSEVRDRVASLPEKTPLFEDDLT